MGFQSTHSLRSATGAVDVHSPDYYVSIHALLAECDPALLSLQSVPSCFNPRTPCGVRQDKGQDAGTVFVFQSTHSLRSATSFGIFWHCSMWFQSTHSLRSATNNKPNNNRKEIVSIHALLAECDRNRAGVGNGLRVSIHALLAECDSCLFHRHLPVRSFNPRTPCGVRRNRLYTLLLNRANHTLRQPP